MKKEIEQNLDFQEYLKEHFELIEDLNRNPDGNLINRLLIKSNKWKITKSSNGPKKYKLIGVTYKKESYIFRFHRLVFFLKYNYFPDQIDHIDQNPSNNLLSNLRESNNMHNHKNKTNSSTNCSKFMGISLQQNNNYYWNVQVCLKNNKKHQKLFSILKYGDQAEIMAVEYFNQYVLTNKLEDKYYAVRYNQNLLKEV